MDWLRLVLLGLMLVSLSALSLAPLIFEGVPGAFGVGFLAFYGGVLLSIIVLRIGWPVSYADWISSGCFYAALGGILAADPALASPARFALFWSFFLASALIRIWIAVTLGPTRDKEAWLLASGLTGLFCAAWLLTSRILHLAGNPDAVLSLDFMIHGLAIAGFGFSIRSRRA